MIFSIVLIIAFISGLIIYNRNERKDYLIMYNRNNLKITWRTEISTGRSERICIYSYKIWQSNKRDNYLNYYDQGSVVRDEEFKTDYIIQGHKQLPKGYLPDVVPFNIFCERTDMLMLKAFDGRKKDYNKTSIYIHNDGRLSFNLFDNNDIIKEIDELLKHFKKTNERLNDIADVLEDLLKGDAIKNDRIELLKNATTSFAASLLLEVLKVGMAYIPNLP